MVRVRQQHFSMQYSDPAHQKDRDAALIFSRAAHAKTFTEVGRGQNPVGQDQLQQEARQHHYWSAFPGYEGGLAIRYRHGRVVDHGYEGPLIHGQAGSNPHLGLTWATVEHDTLGRIVHAVTHFLNRDVVASRRARNDAMGREIARLLQDIAGPDGVAFLSGDFNRDDAHRDVLPGTGFRTNWDDLGVYPDTHGTRTIDATARRRSDRARVRTISGRVIFAGRLFSDHEAIETVHDIKPRRSTR